MSFSSYGPAELAHNIRLSPFSYDFPASFKPNDSAKSRVLRSEDLGKYKLMDAQTGQPIRGPSSVVVGKDGRAGEKLCVIQPALVRRGINGAKDVTLVKATVLASFDSPTLRRGKARIGEVKGGVGNHAGWADQSIEGKRREAPH